MLVTLVLNKRLCYGYCILSTGRAITPAENYMFKVNKTTQKLSEKEAQAFHTIVAKLIFLCKQARPDILTGVAFLTT